MITVLLATAFVLGVLAFFEPCAIATHTLFTVRAHQAPAKTCCSQLFLVWLARSLLTSGLLLLAVVLTSPPAWGAWLPSILLSIMAAVYLISRYVYIPIPHLDFSRLLPRGKHYPDAVKLGLTLPACSLPLFMVILGISITLDGVVWAMVAGLLFATGFSLPMIVAARKGIHEAGQAFLQRAAKGSPWFTAVLLLGAALVLILPQVDLSVPALRTTLGEANWAAIGLGFLAGFVFSFNPVSFASIPVMLAYVTRAFDDHEQEERSALLMGTAFVLGMVVTHVVLGVAAALGGEWVQSVMGRQWGLFLGPLLILLGLIWPGWLPIRLPWFGIRGRRVTGIWGAFLLGIPFSVAVCPFCTPALLVALTTSAAVGSVVFGFGLLLAFALGRSVPIILGAWSMGWLESLRGLSRYQRGFEIIAGVVLILTGLYLLNEYFFFIQY